MDFKFSHWRNAEEHLNELVNSFRSSFWIEEHRWFIRSDWTSFGMTSAGTLYTLPYAFDGFLLTNKKWSKSTGWIGNKYDRVRILTVMNWRTNVIDDDLPWFSNVRHLQIHLPLNETFWSLIQSFDRLHSPELMLVENISYHPLQILLDRSLCLTSLCLGNFNHLQIISQLTSSSIYRLDFLTKNRYKRYMDSMRCNLLINSSLARQCEILLISVENRRNILQLMKNISTLRSLIFQCKDDPSNDDLIIYLQHIRLLEIDTKHRRFAYGSIEFVVKVDMLKTNRVEKKTDLFRSIVMSFIVTSVIILSVIYQLYKHFFPSANINPHGKYVLITGCSSRFGYTLAIELNKQGFNVFDGVRNLQNASSLKQQLSSRSVVFVLDITKQDDIDCMTSELMRTNMDVTFFGHVAMTKKFLPLLISKRDSRVINVSSIWGFISFTSVSAYSTSKYALESFSDCLRREMAPWSLRVSVIEPGAMRTSILNEQESFSRNLWTELSSDIQRRWGEDFATKLIKQIVDSPLMDNAEDSIKAVRATEHAVMNINPKIRYRPGWQAKLMLVIFIPFPDWLVDRLLLAGSADLIPAGIRNQLNN